MTTVKTITVEFSKDTYTLEIYNYDHTGGVCYGIYINGKWSKLYSRLPKDLKEMFGIEGQSFRNFKK